MADNINKFVDNLQLNSLNSLTHLLNTENTDELNVIRHSPYISDDELIQSRLHNTNELSILSLNCQSLQAKFDYIKVLIDKFCNGNHPLQVICLQETWFSANTDLSPYIIPGYHIISTGHYASNHSGLVIYLNDIWNYDIITCDTDSHIWERQIIEITNPSNIARKKITIGNIYRPPYNLQYNIDTFMAEFNATLLQYHGNSSSTYFCGDYNIDLLKIPRIQMYEDYFDNILSAGYIPTITLPTRLSNNSTLIDNIFTNNVGNKLTACILNIHISDHQPVVLFSNHELPTVKTKYITITNNSDEAKAAFILSFENKLVLEQLVETNEDPNYNYEILERALTDSYTECFPKRVVKFNKKKHEKNAWISVGITRSINHRNRLYKHLKQLKTDSFDYVIKKADFNRFRNVLKKTITHAKRLHFKRLFDQFKYNIKKT